VRVTASDARTVAVTGASGYVGGVIARRLRADGWRVVGLCRRAPDGLDEHRPWSLQATGPAPLAGVDALVHAAYDFEPSTWSEIVTANVDGSRRLFEQATRAGVGRVVHISSIAAFAGTRSLYGRAKLRTEAVGGDATVIRPGLVYGPESGAILAALDRVAARLPALPLMVSDAHPLYTVYDEELADVVAAVLDGREPRPVGPLVAASPDPVTLRALLTSLAQSHGRRTPRFVPVPWRAVFGVLKGFERVGLTPPFRSDSALGLATSIPDPFVEGVAPTTLAGRSFSPRDLAPASRA
jgi:nucleoside-diphosphate-sugar epimerase